jgi:hypothetical protein
MSKRSSQRVLAIDPYSRGVGFAVLEGPHGLIDFGLKSTGKADSEKVARATQALIERFRPDVLALEDWNAPGSRRCGRVQTLLNQIVAAEQKRVRVCLIDVKRLRRIGQLPHTSTKYGRARFVAERFPELQPFLPRFRKIWMPEDDRMSIFDAVGFALACLATKVPKIDAPENTETPPEGMSESSVA